MNAELVADLKERVAASGQVSEYLAEEDEARLHDEGQTLGLNEVAVEAAMNQVCRERGWAREAEVARDLRDLLAVVVDQHEAIDQSLFELVVDYAVGAGLPRKHVLRRAIDHMTESALPVEQKLIGEDWFEPLRRRHRELES